MQEKDKQVREAILQIHSTMRTIDNPEPTAQAINTLINLAQSVLECEGFPEKKIYIGKSDQYQCYIDGFNEALDLCKIAHAKILQEKLSKLGVEVNKELLEACKEMLTRLADDRDCPLFKLEKWQRAIAHAEEGENEIYSRNSLNLKECNSVRGGCVRFSCRFRCPANPRQFEEGKKDKREMIKSEREER